MFVFIVHHKSFEDMLRKEFLIAYKGIPDKFRFVESSMAHQ